MRREREDDMAVPARGVRGRERQLRMCVPERLGPPGCRGVELRGEDRGAVDVDNI